VYPGRKIPAQTTEFSLLLPIIGAHAILVSFAVQHAFVNLGQARSFFCELITLNAFNPPETWGLYV
jgi:hypothetical protein